MRAVAITGVGVVTALGNDLAAVRAAIARGESGVKTTDDLRNRLPLPGVGSCRVDVMPLLKRRKDKKLLPRAAELGLVAASVALGEDRPADIGIFMGVGREPPDDPEATDAMMRVSHTDGRFDVDKLATVGLSLYPPLTPLKTLPNLALAHIAINLVLEGEAGTRTGEEAAGLAAIAEGFWSVAEGRSEVALAGGADCRVDGGTTRDLVRLGRCGPGRAPGEGAAFVRMEPVDRAVSRGAQVIAVVQAVGLAPAGLPCAVFDGALGACGAAAGPIALAVLLGSGPGALEMVEATGASAGIRWG